MVPGTPAFSLPVDIGKGLCALGRGAGLGPAVGCSFPPSSLGVVRDHPPGAYGFPLVQKHRTATAPS